MAANYLANLSTNSAPAAPQTSQVGELLQHLPVGKPVAFRQREKIYDGTQSIPRLYLLVSGLVKVCINQPDGRSLALAVYGPDEMFGLSRLASISTLPR